MANNSKTNPEPPKDSAPRKPSLLRRLIQLGLVLVIAIASYALWLQFVAVKPSLSREEQQKFLSSVPVTTTNRLIIPKIAVNNEIGEGDWHVLDQAKSWHRYPERGNPQRGGNFILAAHRYVFAWLPQRVTEMSVLYNIDKLAAGDTIYIDWQSQRYQYTIEKVSLVAPSDTDIEQPTKDSRLTLYSCTLKGERDGRELIIAKPTKP